MEKSLQKQLQARAHHLKPVVKIGHKGLTEAVLAEIDTALFVHELIKIDMAATQEEQSEWILQICTELACEKVQHIGNRTVIFRANPEKEKPYIERL